MQIEEAATFVASAIALYCFSAEWWWFLLLALGPDISVLGYLAGNRWGAALYNIFHHKGMAIAVGASGFALNNEILILSGLVLFGHSAMDRMFGFGLKYNEGFAFTHLGKIGKEKDPHPGSND